MCSVTLSLDTTVFPLQAPSFDGSLDSLEKEGGITSLKLVTIYTVLINNYSVKEKAFGGFQNVATMAVYSSVLARCLSSILLSYHHDPSKSKSSLCLAIVALSKALDQDNQNEIDLDIEDEDITDIGAEDTDDEEEEGE